MNCKPGDLAIQIKSLAGNNGRIVKVIEFAGSNPRIDGDPWVTGLGPCWHVEYCGSPAVINTGGYCKFAPVPDAWLRPISGIPMTDDVTDEVVA